MRCLSDALLLENSLALPSFLIVHPVTHSLSPESIVVYFSSSLHAHVTFVIIRIISSKIYSSLVISVVQFNPSLPLSTLFKSKHLSLELSTSFHCSTTPATALDPATVLFLLLLYHCYFIGLSFFPLLTLRKHMKSIKLLRLLLPACSLSLSASFSPLVSRHHRIRYHVATNTHVHSYPSDL